MLCLSDWIPQASLARWEICEQCHPFWTKPSREASSISPLRVFVLLVPPSVPDISTRWAFKKPWALCVCLSQLVWQTDRQSDSNMLFRTRAFSHDCSWINDPEVQMDPVYILLIFSHFCSVPWAAESLGGALSYLSWSPLKILILESP